MTTTMLSSFTEVTPGSASAWTEVDLSSYIPSSATGAILRFVTNTSTAYAIGWRMHGGTNNVITTMQGTRKHSVVCKVDASRHVDLYVGSTTAVDVYIQGYFESEAYFFDNPTGLSVTTSAWTDVDISSYVQSGHTAVFAILEVSAPTSTYVANVRPDTSTDNRNAAKCMYHCTYFTGLNSNIFEAYQTHADTRFYLTGYLKQNSVGFDNNATHYTTTNASTWEHLTSNLPTNALGGLWNCYSKAVISSHAVGIRDHESSDDYGYSALSAKQQHGWASACTSLVSEGWHDDTDDETEPYLMGWWKTYSAEEDQDITLTTLSITSRTVAPTLVVDYAKTLTTLSFTAASVTLSYKTDYAKTLTTLSFTAASVTLSYKTDYAKTLTTLSFTAASVTLSYKTDYATTLTTLSMTTSPVTIGWQRDVGTTLTTLSMTASPVALSFQADVGTTLTTLSFTAASVTLTLNIDCDTTLEVLSTPLAIIEIGVSYTLNQNIQLEVLSSAVSTVAPSVAVEVAVMLTTLSVVVTNPTRCHIFHGIFEDTCTNELFPVLERAEEIQQGANTIIQKTVTQRPITSKQVKERLVGIIQTLTDQPDVKQVSRQPVLIQIHRDEEVIETLTEQISVIGVAPCGVRVAVD